MYVHDWIDFQVNGFDKKKSGGDLFSTVCDCLTAHDHFPIGLNPLHPLAE